MPYDRGKSYYLRRPTLLTQRRYGHQQPISDFLPSKIYPSKSQLAFTGSVATMTLRRQFVPDVPSKTRIHLKPKLSRKWLITAFAVFIFILGGNTGLMKTSRQQQTGQARTSHSAAVAENPAHPPQQALTSVGLPERLKIPKINVDAALDYVGITPQKELGVPENPADAAWYNLGPRPGEKGNAIIDGHFGYRDHIPAVFDNLQTLRKGDKLYIEDKKGAIITFVVRELRTYTADEYAPAVFRSSDGKAHLNLITCQGTWSKGQKSYSNRLVVFTDRKI